MSLWLSNIPLLLKSLRENDWYITVFPFSFNNQDYIVIFEDLKELDKQIKYFSVNLTFIDLEDTNRQFETLANAYTFNAISDDICAFFGIQTGINTSSSFSIRNICESLNKSVPCIFQTPAAQYVNLMIDKIEIRTNNEGMCCYDVRRNGKTQNGIQKERTAINTAKTKLLRPKLFEAFGKDKTISFFYRKEHPLSDDEIYKMLLSRKGFYTAPFGK